jgi:ubiquinone/menaquinone biosynthesis C-methylase UbiE
MDYDASAIATVYDKARGLAPERMQQWLDLVARDAGPRQGFLIVDLGCGTGRFSEPLADRFSAFVVGIDPSEKMLREAQRKRKSNNVDFRQLVTLPLPIADSSVDMIFMSMVFHHFENAVETANECRRVLRPSGRICVRNSTREANFPHRYFFPAMRPLIETELPTRNQIEEVFRKTGFSLLVHDIVTQVVASTWSEFIDKTALRADSFLARLRDEDFKAGMAALRAHLMTTASDQAVTEELDWYVFEAA